ncbi:hypothetical protein J3F83DRAFT_731520 [Trichoderma novae-zelandiae]
MAKLRREGSADRHRRQLTNGEYWRLASSLSHRNVAAVRLGLAGGSVCAHVPIDSHRLTSIHDAWAGHVIARYRSRRAAFRNVDRCSISRSMRFSPSSSSFCPFPSSTFSLACRTSPLARPMGCMALSQLKLLTRIAPTMSLPLDPRLSTPSHALSSMGSADRNKRSINRSRRLARAPESDHHHIEGRGRQQKRPKETQLTWPGARIFHI